MKRNLVLLGLVVAAAVMRLWTLSSKSLWVDEGLTALCAESFSFALEQTWNVGVNTPGTIFMTVLPYHWWPNEFGLRLVPALFGIATVPAIYFMVRRWSNTAGALSAALFLTISPLHLHHSQDARTYSVMMFCSVLTTYALERLYRQWQEDEPGRVLVGTAALFVLATLLNLYNHYHAILLLGAQGCWVLTLFCLKSTKARRRAFVCSLGLLASIVVGFSPWFPPVLKLAREGWVRATVTRTPVEALQGRAMPGGPEAQLDSTDIVLETLGRLAGKWTLGEVPPPGDWRPTQILQLALALFGAGVLVMKDRKTAVLVGFILSTGLLYVVLAAAPLLVYSRVYLYVRHIAFAYPFFLALQGTAIGFLWRKSRLAGAILVGAYVLSLLPALSFYYRINKQDWRGASEFLMAHVASGDQVVVDCADWGVLAYLQMHGFQLTYDRVRTFEVHRGSTTLTFINPTVPYDSGKRLWWVHAQSSAAPEEILDPQHLRFQSDWGYLGGVIEIYQHGP